MFLYGKYRNRERFFRNIPYNDGAGERGGEMVMVIPRSSFSERKSPGFSHHEPPAGVKGASSAVTRGFLRIVGVHRMRVACRPVFRVILIFPYDPSTLADMDDLRCKAAACYGDVYVAGGAG